MSYKAVAKKLESGSGREIIDHYKKDRSQFISYFKVTPEEYDRLYEPVEAAAKTLLRKRLGSNEERERKIGGGRPFGMCLYAMLGMCLMLYNGHSQYLVAGIFQTNRNAVRTSYDVVSDALYLCLPIPKRISLSIARATTQDTLLKLIPGLEAIVDATNHRTTNSPRRATRSRQHGRLSGPHRKTQVIVNRAGLILHITHSVWSRMHDKRLTLRELPEHIYRALDILHRDLGFPGVKHGARKIVEPIKAARGRKLTEEQREFNKACTVVRSPVERKQGHLKKYGILDRAPWSETEKFDRDAQIVCGLLNILAIWRSKMPVDWGNKVDTKKQRKVAQDMAPLLQDWS